eukprot:TRINITY_DN12584_c2_g3_i1.p1 TRINITY_DN12584_c2_g3~~TRINITY_DN12584_c2_g3_i1.p1  ORF type:complete len:314 (+),score=45.37 TRINITY_DN12584_c2_g3_i1:46-987(+)
MAQPSAQQLVTELQAVEANLLSYLGQLKLFKLPQNIAMNPELNLWPNDSSYYDSRPTTPRHQDSEGTSPCRVQRSNTLDTGSASRLQPPVQDHRHRATSTPPQPNPELGQRRPQKERRPAQTPSPRSSHAVQTPSPRSSLATSATSSPRNSSRPVSDALISGSSGGRNSGASPRPPVQARSNSLPSVDPQQFATLMAEFARDMPYFYGSLGRTDAEQWLWSSQPGTFLVRRSSRDLMLTLSVRMPTQAAERVRHYSMRVVNHPMGKVVFHLTGPVDVPNFSSIYELIDYYQTNSLSDLDDGSMAHCTQPLILQ